MLTGRKYRLELTAEQMEYAEEIGAACRAVWNVGLEQRREYRRRRAFIHHYEQSRQLTEAKTEFDWLRRPPSHVLQQTLADLDVACKQRGTFAVKWRSARSWSPSFRFPSPNDLKAERLGKRTGRCKLPKFGWVRFRWTRPLGGAIRSATVSKDGPNWFVSFRVEDGLTTPEVAGNASAVGVDRGVAVAIACSDGTMRDRQFSSTGERERYKRLQRHLARQAKGSANRRKTLAAMRRIKRSERDRRRDFTTWTANWLATRYGLVVLEDLKIRNMTKSAKGTLEEPGKGVAQKSGLNRAIMDKGWYQLELAIKSAARYTGSQLVKVPAAYTSQRCSACQVVDRASRESQAVFRCTACGYLDNSDLNAAKNILAAGLAVTACGDFGVARSAKQEPAGKPRGTTCPTAPESGHRRTSDVV